jgi:hypothetical protein
MFTTLSYLRPAAFQIRFGQPRTLGRKVHDAVQIQVGMLPLGVPAVPDPAMAAEDLY